MWHCLHDPEFSRFSRTPICDRYTTTAYTALSEDLAVLKYDSAAGSNYNVIK